VKRRTERRLRRIKAEKTRRQASRDAEVQSQQETCQSHRPFTTYKAALDHYRLQVHEGRADPGQVVFRCGRCGSFHHGGAGAPSLGRLMSEQDAGPDA
jgi:hypothetical protein